MNQRITIILIICTFNVWSQIDKKFWFAAPDISRSHADRPIYLKFSTLNKEAKVKVSIPAQKLTLGEFNVAIDNISTLDLTSKINLIENGNYGDVSQQGILIESDQEITAYYEVVGSSNYGVSNSDIYSLKGSNALGTEFYLPMQNYWACENKLIDAFASFQIVATEDNTIIEISPTQDLSNASRGSTFSITLNKGEVYNDRARTTNPILRPTGTYIKSSKKIAITISDDSMYDATILKNGFGAWDLAGDQIVPVSRVGTHYVVNRASVNNNRIDKAFITATEDSTVIVMNQTDTIKINKSQTDYFILELSSNSILSNKPIYVFHIGGYNSELGGALLPPLQCTGSKKVTIGFDNRSGLGISIVVPKGGENNFKTSGIPTGVMGSNFRPVPGDSNFLWNVERLPTLDPKINKIIIENSSHSFQMGLFHGYDGTFTYGFFSDFGSINLEDTIKICPNTIANINAGFGKDSYKWYFNDKDTTLTDSEINTSSEGLFKVIAQKGNCTFTDSSYVYLLNTDKQLFNIDSVFYCPENQLTVKPEKKHYKSFLWSTNNTSNFINPIKDGTISLIVTDSNDCVIKDSVYIAKHLIKKLSYDYTSEKEICDLNQLCVNFENENFYKKISLNDSTYNSGQICFATPIPSKITISSTDFNGCIQQDSIKYDCSPYIGTIPNVITSESKDALNDQFSIPKLIDGIWTLKIYNRFGRLVFEDESYNNNWDASDVGKGVYYYELTHNYREIKHKGWVEVK